MEDAVMSTIVKINAEGQTTIPLEIYNALAVKPGDLIEWEVTGDGRAEVRRILPVDDAYLHGLAGTLNEWASRQDDEAYGDL